MLPGFPVFFEGVIVHDLGHKSLRDAASGYCVVTGQYLLPVLLHHLLALGNRLFPVFVGPV